MEPGDNLWADLSQGMTNSQIVTLMYIYCSQLRNAFSLLSLGETNFQFSRDGPQTQHAADVHGGERH